jgi:hypothetical protein
MGEEMKPLKVDEHGNVILNPVTGWRPAPVGGIVVLLALDYATSQEGLERGEVESIQLVLTHPQCLSLADLLTKEAQRLLASHLPPGKSPQ